MRSTTAPAGPDDRQRRRFGSALHDARVARALSQTELATRSGVTQPAVSGWEQGKFAPEPPQVFALERALGIPPGGLSAHLGYVPVAAGTVPPGDVAGAIMACPSLDAVEKRAFLAMFEQLSARVRNRADV